MRAEQHIAVVTPGTLIRDYGLNPTFRSVCGCGTTTTREGALHNRPELVDGKPVACLIWLGATA